MRKRNELSNPNSCLSKARDGEMIFVTLCRDKAARVAIRAWIAERIRLSENEPDDLKMIDAEECAQIMELERDATRQALRGPTMIPADSLAAILGVALAATTMLAIFLAYFAGVMVGHTKERSNADS